MMLCVFSLLKMTISMSDERWTKTNQYLNDVFGKESCLLHLDLILKLLSLNEYAQACKHIIFEIFLSRLMSADFFRFQPLLSNPS
jgi:hypothetical protein